MRGVNKNIGDILKDSLFDADNQNIPKNASDECKYCLLKDVSENQIENCKLYPCTCTTGVHFGCLKSWF